MMRRCLPFAAVGLVLFLSAEVVLAGGAQRGAVERVALAYLEALYEPDFDRAHELLAPDALFSDPTAGALTGQEVTYRGADAIVDAFRAAAANATDLGFELVESFHSGEWAVLKVRYRSNLVGEAFGRPGLSIPIEVDAVTILRIVDGRVTEHLDHVDYDHMLEQVRTYEPDSR